MVAGLAVAEGYRPPKGKGKKKGPPCDLSSFVLVGTMRALCGKCRCGAANVAMSFQMFAKPDSTLEN